VLGVGIPVGAFAQAGAGTQTTELDTIAVTGIRGSLQSSMNLKRDSAGVVDGIIAEDIGKFPDTNLAESLQRISGVSIDRTLSGEGSRVTVRGIGADFNQVLLNGRQMPASNLGQASWDISGSRAFDFANLASEAVSELQIYKTARADAPTGGIGATINIRTSRPLDNPGLRAQIGVKGVMDSSVDNQPHSYPGKSLTPEVSGIFSQTFADDRFGIAVSASYQSRDSAYSQVRVNQGWRPFRGDDNSSIGRLPLPGDSNLNDYDIINRPGPNDIYARPQNFQYLVSSTQRQRRNSQITLQYAPTDRIVTTLDYTYADNRIQQQRNELQVTLTPFGPGASTWTDGAVAAPIQYTQYAPSSYLDLNLAGGEVYTRSELESLGFNAKWKVSDGLDLSFDYHNSSSESRPDNPQGASNYILTPLSAVRGNTTVDFSKDFPILSIKLAPGITEIGPEHARMGFSGFRNSFNRSEVEQWQASGAFRFADYQVLDFGLASTDVYNRATRSDNGGVAPGNLGTAADYDDSIWYADNMGRYFKSFPGHNDPNLSDRFLVFDFQRLRDRAIEMTGRPDWYTAPSETIADLRTFEKTRSAYLQWKNTFDLIVPVNVAAGIRYEKTEISSPTLISPPAGNLVWNQPNELLLSFQDNPIAGDFNGEYHYWLPSLDARAELREDLVLRASYSKSIGRPGWRDIQGGLSLVPRYQIFGGTGNLGNPGLLPLQSKNVDLSLEWYYGEGSYVSIGWFRKSLKDFVGTETTRQSPYPITSPIGGGYWMNAITVGGCGDSDLNCIRNYIFANHAADPGVDLVSGTIAGQPGDPVAVFDITTPTNQRSDKLDGWELSVQHMFGRSGFGVSVNYTKVDSGLNFNNEDLGAQFPMVGLSDSANLVVFYDKYNWQVRAAYNWRDEFLSRIGGGAGTVADPNYTERYGQLDMNVTWQMNQHLSFFVEGINLTDETQRIYGRHQNMLLSASQTGPRYMFGVHYKF